MRVLVVDDDVDLIDDLMAIKPDRMEMLAASGADEAVRVLKEQRVDAVVLDLRMPASLAAAEENEGLALLGAIMGAFRGRVPVVIATDSDDPELMMWCGRLGAAELLRKDVGPTRVLGAVLDAVGRLRGQERLGWSTRP